ncbi:SRPBCC domain-containing protein [Fodinibius salsisoli]|uniref:SRPBCC domain-containing protein n=1 Tax=Fodinibius salsisoli TaxID=2820877 RepID=A0ABT3PHZ9_9BACT|nr:SRPBCC domain-containing protein [Fodinibius salsisoli]MCW9705539.1 SRPBCC domain-containing protein [Fodinibius salsisoli]
MGMNKMNVETKERELIIERIFDAPPELVFEAYSSCNHLKHWWGPKEWPMEECEMDFREGGKWHYCLRGPNEGDESWGKAIYKEIDKPGKLVYEDYFSDKDGNINEEMPGMLITVVFIEHGGKTKLSSTTLFDSPETLKKVVEMGAVEGMTSSLDRLDEYLAQLTTNNQ